MRPRCGFAMWNGLWIRLYRQGLTQAAAVTHVTRQVYSMSSPPITMPRKFWIKPVSSVVRRMRHMSCLSGSNLGKMRIKMSVIHVTRQVYSMCSPPITMPRKIWIKPVRSVVRRTHRMSCLSGSSPGKMRIKMSVTHVTRQAYSMSSPPIIMPREFWIKPVTVMRRWPC